MVQEINKNIANEFNPTAAEANRMDNTTSVEIAFNGPKVPNYVRYWGLLAECSLYRKQIDICYKSGCLCHRMDVCPNPTDQICRGCDKVRKGRFKIPYVVWKRQWERRNANDTSPEASKPPRKGGEAAVPKGRARERRRRVTWPEQLKRVPPGVALKVEKPGTDAGQERR
ncbi:hypothetical protein HPB48_019955 [Haemaphysalis longicornis]|uniref:Uncharacterized protein n=1 Tax=Haemaphysalis longicornis TaxID=44386 RepID=A0A9J6FR09_HAELO|nr:hypothetical protein HPB48_019955 [Haemaphysalis longicornis]